MPAVARVTFQGYPGKKQFAHARHESFAQAFSKACGVEGRSPSSPIAMGEILQILTSSGGEAKPSGGRFGRGEP